MSVVRLEIDNNLVENAIGPTAVGKKSFLFVGHPQAGQRSAVLYLVLAAAGDMASTLTNISATL